MGAVTHHESLSDSLVNHVMLATMSASNLRDNPRSHAPSSNPASAYPYAPSPLEAMTAPSRPQTPIHPPRSGSLRSPAPIGTPALKPSLPHQAPSALPNNPTTRSSSFKRHSRSLSRHGTISSPNTSLSFRKKHLNMGQGQAIPLDPVEFLEILHSEFRHSSDEKLSASPTSAVSRPLVIDVRPLPEFVGPAGRIRGSINCNFPSLLMKRFKRGKPMHFSLESFITTEQGKKTYQAALAQLPSSSKSSNQNTLKQLSDLDIFVVDDKIEDSDDPSAGAILVSVLQQLLPSQAGSGSLCFLKGSFSSLGELPAARGWLRQGDDAEPNSPVTTRQVKTNGLQIYPSAASPAEDGDATKFKSKPPRLKRIDTSEQLRLDAMAPEKSRRSKSPSPLVLDAAKGSDTMPHASLSLQELCRLQANTPKSALFNTSPQRMGSPRATPSPSSLRDVASNANANVNANVPSTPREEAEAFVISSIIPSFLYLGSEPLEEAHVDELVALGVKQVLNMALEITPNDTLGMLTRFEKYLKIPMRDFVEETGVQQRIDQACAFLDDAELKSKPVYVHCKAGKSRSVTIVLAYLIHRYHWSLRRAYAHVAERRTGISPNIGFISELMRFEERSLGVKSSGVTGLGASVPPSSSRSMGMTSASPFAVADTESPPKPKPTIHRTNTAPSKKTFAPLQPAWSRLRDSLPPMSTATVVDTSDTSFDYGDLFAALREQEVKGSSGHWIHARQDESNDQFLPNKRASKAGLESSRDAPRM